MRKWTRFPSLRRPSRPPRALARPGRVKGDGRMAVFVYEARSDSNVVEAFTFNGTRLKRVLNTYQPWDR